MSEIKHMLEIKPDPHGARTETRYASGFACPRCSGQGGFPDMAGHNQRTFIPCDLCDGTGKVKVVVTLEWAADYES